MLLEMAMTSPPNQTAVMRRENVAVKTPAGETVPLATQREFNEAYGILQPDLGRQTWCAIRWTTGRRERAPARSGSSACPGPASSFDEVTVNDFRACKGRFLFNIPGGVQAGRYVLTMNLDKSEIEIPITFTE